MKANYHTHTWRCNHAESNERAFIERAIEGGIQILGFSEHTPYPFPDGKESWFRMQTSQIEEYVNTLSALKKEYEKDIEIHIGLEAEYYPRFFHKLQDLIRPYPVEYMILGQHYIRNELEGDSYNAQKTWSKKKLIQYCDQVIEALQTGYFTYFAHPDLLNFKGPKTLYQEEMRRVCQVAKDMSIPLEINFLGLMEKRNYPVNKFWEVVAEVGNDVILGCDAHKAKYVYAPDAEEIAHKKFIDKYKLHLVETVNLRKPV